MGRKGKAAKLTERLQAFLSYSTKDKVLAGRLKKEFAHLGGIELFLAPKDLEPSREQWRNRIIQSIRRCDVFLPLLTKHFKESEWTDQETGMAIALRKVIVPLKVGYPRTYGFLESYTYKKVKVSPVLLRKSCAEILMAIRKDKKLGERVQWSFIDCFNSSPQFAHANERSEMLEILGPYNPKQINSLLQGYLGSVEIHHGFTASRKVIDLLIRNKKALSAALIRQARNVPKSQRDEYFHLDELLGHL
jgi:hypothetical protein